MLPQIQAERYHDSSFILIGSDPLTVAPNGKWLCRIQTLFIERQAIITTPGVHADQRLLFIDYLNQQRELNGQAKLTKREEYNILSDAVAIVAQYDEVTNEPYIGIRTDSDPERAMRGREVLCKVIPPEKVRIFNI